MAHERHHRDADAEDKAETEAEDILSAFNAEGVIDDPGRPTAERSNPVDRRDDASDADAPAP